MVQYNRGLDATFRALADPTRRAILSDLRRGQTSVSVLATPHGMSLQAVMEHLRVLERAGLVKQRKRGRVRRCRLAARPLKHAEAWLSQYRVFWENQLDALDRYLMQGKNGGRQMSTAQPSINTTLQIKRTFAAKRERVFRAWTDAGELSRWFAPSAEYSTVVPELELRVGGRYRIEMHHKGGNVHSVYGAYQEIKPPEKVVFTWKWDGDTSPEASLVTVEFHDLGNSTEVAVTHERLPNLEQRDKHAHGWNGCLDRLVGVI